MQCRECGTPMRPQRSPNDGRPTHHARGLCKRCYTAARRTGTIETYDVNRLPLEDLVEDVEWMRDTGENPINWARRVGMNNNALAQRLHRAGRRDLARLVDQAVREDKRRVAA